MEFDVTVTEKDLLHYKLYHKYHSFSGLCEIVLGVLLITLGTYALMHLETMNLTFGLLALLFGVVFLVVIPVQLIGNSRKAASRPEFAQPMHYRVDEKGVEVKLGEETARADWDTVYRVKSTKQCVLVYFTPTRANIIPKREIQECYQQFKELVIAGIGTYRWSGQ